ncbi:MAG TPA: BadF/BadG/BcrA/BcrD ATPase family protein [Microbacterium sp.]|uniref:N-acetylglucosamine kinase n=1 Tax=Microbacterium sp. TaxID=51671 RepID=UPI002B49EE23|nr:BadF/BadG/BcrA/BcrD ATPase family protein [Microbacterium sp.]HKT55399.1 BadF/BadG/BcrA/BcrD ATPase family protein [Microbacterium sp.]
MQDHGSATGPAAAGSVAPGLVLGIDVGGSKTHAVLSDGRTVIADILAGSANPASVGVEEASRQLGIVFAQLGSAPISAICAGVAGADSPGGEERFRTLLTLRAPNAAIRVVHDSELLLAAAGRTTGVAVISGTGSAGWGRDATGRTARAGGWGYLLGDEGSGYWVTRQAVRHALERVDLGEPADRLSQQLAADCGLQDPADILDHFYANPERRYWAGRARIVFELAADREPVSAAIVASAADALTHLATSVALRLGLPGPVVLAGGQAVHQPLLQQAVRERLAARGIDELEILTAAPVEGAVRLATELLTLSV